MKIFATTLAIIFTIPVAANDSLFQIDAEKALDIAVAAALEHNPDISVEDLMLSSGITLHCLSTDPSREVSVVDVELSGCFATVSFHLSPTKKVSAFISEEGACIVSERAARVSVRVHPDGSTHVSEGEGSTDMQVDCDEDFESFSE